MAEINQAQLGKIAGLKRQAIYNAVRRGQIIINSAKMVDTQNKTNSEWLMTHGITQQKIDQFLSEIQENEKPKQESQPRSNPNLRNQRQQLEKPIDIRSDKNQPQTRFINGGSEVEEMDFETITGLPSRMMGMTIKELVIKYGGPMMLDQFSKILQRLMTADEKDQKIQERRQELIEKDFVISGVFSYLNILSDNLFDLAESKTDLIVAAVKADEEKAKKTIRDMLLKDFSKIIKNTKRSIDNSMRNMRSKYDKADDATTE